MEFTVAQAHGKLLVIVTEPLAEIRASVVVAVTPRASNALAFLDRMQHAISGGLKSARRKAVGLCMTLQESLSGIFNGVERSTYAVERTARGA